MFRDLETQVYRIANTSSWLESHWLPRREKLHSREVWVIARVLQGYEGAEIGGLGGKQCHGKGWQYARGRVVKRRRGRKFVKVLCHWWLSN
jgi:hypothetical protein